MKKTVLALSAGLCVQAAFAADWYAKETRWAGHDPDITHRAYTLGRVEDIVAAPGAEPNLLIKQIGMFPVNHMQRKPVIFMRNYGERMLAKGGSWFDRDTASLFELYMREDRKWIAQDIGFRACWADPG